MEEKNKKNVQEIDKKGEFRRLVLDYIGEKDIKRQDDFKSQKTKEPKFSKIEQIQAVPVKKSEAENKIKKEDIDNERKAILICLEKKNITAAKEENDIKNIEKGDKKLVTENNKVKNKKIINENKILKEKMIEKGKVKLLASQVNAVKLLMLPIFKNKKNAKRALKRQYENLALTILGMVRFILILLLIFIAIFVFFVLITN